MTVRHLHKISRIWWIDAFLDSMRVMMNPYVQQLMFRTSWGSHPPNHELRLRVFFTKALQHNEVQTTRSMHRASAKQPPGPPPRAKSSTQKGPRLVRDMLGTPQESRFMLGFAGFVSTTLWRPLSCCVWCCYRIFSINHTLSALVVIYRW